MSMGGIYPMFFKKLLCLFTIFFFTTGREVEIEGKTYRIFHSINTKQNWVVMRVVGMIIPCTFELSNTNESY
jgi:hypothetical protein